MRLGGGGAGFPGEGMLIAGERGGLVIVDGAPCGSLRCKKVDQAQTPKPSKPST